MVLFVVHDFQTGSKFRVLQNVSINFLLFYKNNLWLKTDIILWKMVLFMVRNFQNGGKYRTLWNVSFIFLLFYKNNVMLKTDIMLDYW